MMADQNQGLSESGRKESNCVRCRNHGLKIILRGHKQYCQFATCVCDKCRFTQEQQRQMRLQNAIRRAEANDRSGTTGRRKRNSNQDPNVIVAPTLVSPQQTVVQHVQQVAVLQPQQQHQHPQQQEHHQHQIIVTTVANIQQDLRNGGSPNDEKKILFDCSSELLKKFRYPWEMMPIMYALSKYANGNIDEILQKIDEGQFAVNEQLRLQTLNMYFGTAQNSTTVPATRECG